MQWSDVVARPSPKVLRQFAVLCLVVFGVMAGLGFWRGHGLTIGLGIALAGLVVGLVGVVQPAAIRWVYSGWMIAVFPIGWTLSRLMLAGLFFLVFTPVAVLFRLIRRDVLHLRQQDERSYWIPKAGAASADQYYRQF
jgi:hypothetical protein